MSDTPRSIRLNKNHRNDIIEAVMQQWEKTNPAPKGATYESFIKAMLAEAKKVPAKAPAEFRALKHIIKRTTGVKKLLDGIDATYREYIKVDSECDFRFRLVGDNGEMHNEYVTSIPTGMLDELNIPYVRSHERSYRSELFPSYRNDHGQAEFGSLVCSTSYITIVLPSNCKAYQDFKKGKRALALWGNEREKVRSEIWDYLQQFNTTGQIRDGWPEMEQYLPAHIADPARVIQLPALTRSRLNERLGIQ